MRSLAIGSPADGAYAVKLARESDGAILAVPDEATVEAIRLLAETEGILTETAGGVTLAALRRAIADGAVRPDEEVVLVITGNGLKTLDALGDDRGDAARAHRPDADGLRGLVGRRARERRPPEEPSRPDLTPVACPSRSCGPARLEHRPAQFALDGWHGLPSHSGLDVTTPSSEAQADAALPGGTGLDGFVRDDRLGAAGPAPRAADTDRGDCGLFICSEPGTAVPPAERDQTTMRALITGAGNMGRAIAAALTARGDEVVAVVGRGPDRPQAADARRPST